MIIRTWLEVACNSLWCLQSRGFKNESALIPWGFPCLQGFAFALDRTVGPGFLLLSSDPLYSVALWSVTLDRWGVVCS